MLRQYIHLKTGDKVKIITGDDRGKIGNVLSVDTKNNRIKVAGIRMQTHYKKRTNEQPGSIEKKEGWIHASNASKIVEGTENENI